MCKALDEQLCFHAIELVSALEPAAANPFASGQRPPRRLYQLNKVRLTNKYILVPLLIAQSYIRVYFRSLSGWKIACEESHDT